MLTDEEVDGLNAELRSMCFGWIPLPNRNMLYCGDGIGIGLFPGQDTNCLNLPDWEPCNNNLAPLIAEWG